jgi:hypothetical protein
MVEKHSQLPRARLPLVDGSWITEGKIFLLRDGRVGFTYPFLKQNYKDIASWYGWLDSHAPILGRCITAFRVKGESSAWGNTLGGELIIWLAEDVIKIAEFRKDSQKHVPTGRRGTWIGEKTNMWQDDEYSICLDDQLLASSFRDMDGFFSPSQAYCSRLRDKPHHVLGNRPARSVVFVKPNGYPIKLTCFEDCSKIVLWERERRRKIIENPPQAPPGWKDKGGLALHLGVRTSAELFALSHALAEFVSEHPNQVCRVERIGRSNIIYEKLFVDPHAFQKWKGPRTLCEIAETRIQKTRRELESGAKIGKRRRKAILFLYFVLTTGKYGPRIFKRFLRNPPVGKQLKPCPPVALEELFVWAGKAIRRGRYNPSSLLKSAKKFCGAKSIRLEGKSHWFFPSPVTIPAELVASGQGDEQAAARVRGSNAATKPKKNRHGPDKAELTLEIGQQCYEGLRKEKRIVIASRIKRQYDRPRFSESQVSIYASRYAKEAKKPWPLSEKG